MSTKHSRRPRGSIYTRPDSPFLWISYSCNGRKVRENTKQTNEKVANKQLARRLGEVAEGRFVSMDVNKTAVQELWQLVERDYSIQGRKSGATLHQRWTKHLKPFFGFLKAHQVTSDSVARFVDSRIRAGAKPATINREVMILSRMFVLGVKCGKVRTKPSIPRLAEHNTRTGFVDSAERERLASACAKEGLWMRAWFECAVTLSWRVSELLSLRVKQVDLADRSVRLNPGETKNGEGRLAFLTDAAFMLIQACVNSKAPEDYVFTRKNGKAVSDFRRAWDKATQAAGVPGLLVHDLRRTGVRNMVRNGIPQSVCMAISGHKTISVFSRYNITDEGDLRQAAWKMSRETPRVTELSHVSVTVPRTANPPAVN